MAPKRPPKMSKKVRLMRSVNEASQSIYGADPATKKALTNKINKKAARMTEQQAADELKLVSLLKTGDAPKTSSVSKGVRKGAPRDKGKSSTYGQKTTLSSDYDYTFHKNKPAEKNTVRRVKNKAKGLWKRFKD